jgi:tetratricopeptide (TPR) repeat protein
MFMTCPHFLPLPAPLSERRAHRRNRLLPLLLLALFPLEGCSLFSSGTAPQKPTLSQQRQRLSRSLSYRFEWAVQNYEAGHYKEAIDRFQKLRQEGSAVGEFELIPFYLGMSHFRIGQLAEGEQELNAFLKASPQRNEAQDARITLLLLYEKQRDWNKTLGLAAETEKQALFQYNRAVLKLVWARALAEEGELKGARAVLKDAEQFLESSGSPDSTFTIFSDPNQDLWGRYHFTEAMIAEKSCRLMNPKELAGKKKDTRRLYEPWLEASVDCLRHSLVEADRQLFQKESVWSPEVGAIFLDSVDLLGNRVKGYIAQEKEKLDRQHLLEKNAREHLYRLLSTIDDLLKSVKKQRVETSSLESIRKRIDLLLLQISKPS